MVTDLKDQYIAELKKAGYQAGDDHGIAYVYIGNALEIPKVFKRMKKIAETVGYTASRGVAVRAGASHEDVPEPEDIETGEDVSVLDE